MGTVFGLVAAACALAIPAAGQPAIRRVTNIEALQAFPGFYHLHPVTIAGTIALGDDGRLQLTAAGGSIAVVTAESAPDGESEVRGEFWATASPLPFAASCPAPSSVASSHRPARWPW
jgi:hypothetical protein